MKELKKLQYYTHIDFNKTLCYFELDGDFYCRRVIYASKYSYRYSMFDFENETYQFPDESFVDDVKEMTVITKEEFEDVWQKDDAYFGEREYVKKMVKFNRE